MTRSLVIHPTRACRSLTQLIAGTSPRNSRLDEGRKEASITIRTTGESIHDILAHPKLPGTQHLQLLGQALVDSLHELVIGHLDGRLANVFPHGWTSVGY